MTDPDLTNRFTFRITMAERGGNFAQDEHGEEDVLFINDGKGNFTPRRPLENAPFDCGNLSHLSDIRRVCPEAVDCEDCEDSRRDVWRRWTERLSVAILSIHSRSAGSQSLERTIPDPEPDPDRTPAGSFDSGGHGHPFLDLGLLQGGCYSS